MHPVQVDSQGHYLTHHLKGAFRRSIEADKGPSSQIHYKVKAFGEDLHLTLTKNQDLMAPNFISNVLGRNGKVLRSRKLRNCHYHGRTKSHESSKVAISNCKGLVSQMCCIEKIETTALTLGGSQVVEHVMEESFSLMFREF